MIRNSRICVARNMPHDTANLSSGGTSTLVSAILDWSSNVILLFLCRLNFLVKFLILISISKRFEDYLDESCWSENPPPSN